MNLFGELAKSTINRALGNTGPQLSFSIGDKAYPQPENSIWILHNGISKADKQEITVFIFEFKHHPKMIYLARNALKRLKTIRYPGIPRFIDGAETETSIIFGTQKLEPLLQNLPSANDNLLKLGLYNIASTLRFLSQECKLIHANVNMSSIFITKSGEWMLGGIEFMGPPDPATFKSHSNELRHQLLPPEFEKYITSDAISRLPVHVIDAWLFGVFVHVAFKNTQITTASLNNRGNIPQDLFKYVRGLFNLNPEMRITFEQFLGGLSSKGEYFDDKLIEAQNFLQNFAIQEKEAKEAFLSEIETTVDVFPLKFCQFRLLPELIQCLQFGGAGSKALKPILIIGSRLSAADFNSLVIPSIINLFKSTDRNIRLALCEKMHLYIDNITSDDANNVVYPNLTSGFADQTPVIREQTLKAVAVLSPKLKPNIINESLIRHLAKLLSDPIPGIRTVLISNKNTIICMAKLAQYLDRDTRSKILVHGFSQMLKDPFPFARKAALMGISASGSSITNEDIAKRIIPSIGAVLLDQDKPIRTLAFDVLNVLVKRLREWSDAKIDTPPPDIGKEPKSESNGWSVPAIATSFLTGRNSSTKATPLVSPSPSRSSPAPPFASQTLSSTHPPLIPTTEGPRQTNPMNLRPDSKKKLVIRLEAENEWGSNWNEDAIFDDPTKSTFIDVNQLPKVNQVPKTQLDPGGGWDDKWSPERTTSKKEDIWEDWG